MGGGGEGGGRITTTAPMLVMYKLTCMRNNSATAVESNIGISMLTPNLTLSRRIENILSLVYDGNLISTLPTRILLEIPFEIICLIGTYLLVFSMFLKDLLFDRS
jgi:hypothetical protein